MGDTAAPTITSVAGSTNAIEDTVTITFSEAMKKETAENIENYVMTVNATIITAKPTTVTYTETNGYQVVIKYPTETLGLASGGKVLVENAIEGEYQGVVFTDSAQKYEIWKRSNNQTNGKGNFRQAGKTIDFDRA